MLDLSHNKTYMTDSHHRINHFSKELVLENADCMDKSIDKQWTQLYDKVSEKPHMCASVVDTLSLLEESIYTEAANIFGHLQPKKRNVSGQCQQTECSI